MGVFRHSFDADGPDAGKVEVTGTIVRTTDKALLLNDGTADHWLPKRFCTVREARGGRVEVLMPQWLAKEKRFI